MLFQVEMDVRVPPDFAPEKLERLKVEEKARCHALMTSGKWRHIWRVAGRYANLSIFDVESPAELHELLSTLPLFALMEIRVAALCHHPSSIRDDDR
ncbi:muconolactone Delta-isomerase [Sphingomonas fennica]|uniref:Muconolactone Delta-isomerase n=1 Tax=Edaphosphingomonas fennica TaxID=114404 RepID=A0A2T4HLW7_9SPHN|nr:muconolactone Delta-isomerase family protein [Sphingomonas fennica]PTD16801.1 muconolactone delta-isomerase [Sphingomonas fennica]